jgi:hypothetical protein
MCIRKEGGFCQVVLADKSRSRRDYKAYERTPTPTSSETSGMIFPDAFGDDSMEIAHNTIVILIKSALLAKCLPTHSLIQVVNILHSYTQRNTERKADLLPNPNVKWPSSFSSLSFPFESRCLSGRNSSASAP